MTDVQVQHVRVSDVDFAYRRAGSGEPLLFLHGMGMTRRWLPIHAALAERFDVIAPEHPGFGDSVRPRRMRTLDDFVGAEGELLTSLGVERFHLVGHSLGGMLAAMLAAAKPARVRSLSLIAPIPLPGVTPEEFLPSAPAPDTDFDQLLFNGNKESYLDYLNANDDGVNVAVAGPGDDPVDHGIDYFDAPELHTQLASITCPRQVIVPDEDMVFDNRCFDIWAQALGATPTVHIAGATLPTGHLLIVQEPAAIATAVASLAAGA